MFRADLSKVPEPYRGLIKNLLDAIKKVLGDSLISVVVYGSVARGEARADSDIDILVIAENLPASGVRRVKLFEVAENSTIKDLLEHIRDYISRRIGEGLMEKRLILTVLVNGEAIVNLDHVLKDGDTVTFMSLGNAGNEWVTHPRFNHLAPR